MEYKVGDRVQVLLHSRAKGVLGTGGGWSSDWLDGTIIKINPVNVVVKTDEYYYGHVHSVPVTRIRTMP